MADLDRPLSQFGAAPIGVSGGWRRCSNFHDFCMISDSGGGPSARGLRDLPEYFSLFMLGLCSGP
jgi:hypothetical protein